MSTPPQTGDDPGPLTHKVAAAARRLGVGRKTLDRMIDAGEISYIQYTPGGDRWIEEAELVRVIDSHRINANENTPRVNRRDRAAATAA